MRREGGREVWGEMRREKEMGERDEERGGREMREKEMGGGREGERRT